MRKADFMQRILIIDDDEAVRRPLRRTFERAGFAVIEGSSVKEGERAAKDAPPDAILLDLKLRGRSSLPAIERLSRRCPVVMMTGYASVEVAVEALKRGARDFIEKPFVLRHVVETARRVIQEHEAGRTGDAGAPLAICAGATARVIVESDALKRVFLRVDQVARTPRTTVLIQGESGVGKELVARGIHDRSARAGGPFVAVNCAALQESLLESELFGYERGAFTGAALEGRPGLFDAAQGGTLLLDEVSEMGTGLQAKLLRVLEERRYRPVGAQVSREADIRVVCATNRALPDEVRAGRFRADLYYRLRVFPIVVPPLRERPDDIIPLAEHFLQERAAQFGRVFTGFTAAARRTLLEYEWPGNVRELRNAVEHAAVVAAAERIGPGDLLLEPMIAPPPPPPAACCSRTASASPLGCGGRIDPPAATLALTDRKIASAERELIRVVLGEVRGKKTRAAKLLGINRTTLYNKIRDYGLA